MRITSALTAIIVFFIITPMFISLQAQTGDEDAIRATIRNFFDSYAAKDLEGIMSLWSESSPAYQGRKATFRAIFSQTGEITLKNLAITSVKVADTKARVSLAVELNGKDKATGQDSPALGKLDRRIYLSKESGAWKIWLYTPSSLIDALFSVRSSPERLWLLRQEREQVTEAVFQRLNRSLNDAVGDKRDSTPMLVMGHAPQLGNFGDLPATGREARAISALFGVTPLIGADASESRAKEEMGRARYIHFAVHGVLNEAAPMYSAVVLAQVRQEDGLLHARKIFDLDLKAELVVLSACQTALGQDVSGEGIVGLSWSLFVAGASSTVVSQWAVQDNSTRELMEKFYSRLKSQGGRPDNFASALREVQLSLLRGRRYRGPYFWAPFVLVGAW